VTTLYHTWFSEDSKWSITTDSTPGPPPGYLPGGPNADYTRTGQQCSHLGRCQNFNVPAGTPPAKRYAETNLGWPVNSWEITENMNAYQLAYLRLLSKFVDLGGVPYGTYLGDRWEFPPVSIRPNSRPAAESKIGGIQYKRVHRGIELRAKDNAEVKIFGLNGALVSRHKFSGGVHTISLAKLPKGMYVVRMAVDGERKVLRIPVLK